MPKRIAAAIFVFMGFAFPVLAQALKAEVAPGIFVTRKVFPVPDNESPFFNFIGKTEELEAIDRRMVEGVLMQVPDRARAARYAAEAGWKEFRAKKDIATATRRFNQAFLLDPRESIVYHSFAVAVAERFRDYDYADELFRLAATLNSPATTLSGDHGRALAIAGRLREAKPLLEKGIRDDPDWAVPRSNLSWVVFNLGDAAEACRLASEATGREFETIAGDIQALKQKAKC